MKKQTGGIRTAGRVVRAIFGDLSIIIKAVIRVPWFVHTIFLYSKKYKKIKEKKFKFELSNLYPCLTDAYQEAGALGHYFYQDLWAAKKIFERRPSKHVDIGSRIDGFIAHILVFMPVEIVDVRPLMHSVKGMSFIQDDATMLTKYSENSIESLSSLHAIEHFGLGRYGDAIDPDGWRYAVSNIKRVLQPGGSLYFSVPIGRERLEFNAHRVFSPETIVEAFKGLELVEFSVVDDKNTYIWNTDWRNYSDAYFACGLFEFRK